MAASAISLPPFQQLLDAHGRDVYRFLVATVGRLDADDCYQETWIAALRGYPRLRNDANLRGWIFTVAHRKALDHLRSRRRAPVPVGEVPEPSGALPGGVFPGEAIPGGVLPGGAFPGGVFPAAPAAERDGEVWALVRDLPPKQRTALALRYLTDSAYAEIAAVMGISEEAARRNVHEGLKRLRMEYEPS